MRTVAILLNFQHVGKDDLFKMYSDVQFY